MALRQAKIITVTSVKGGVGKTTLALNLAGLISLEKKKVLVLDADLYGNAVALSTKADQDKTLFTLVDDLKNNRFISEQDYVTKYNEYLSILPAPKDPRQANKIGSKYTHIVLDEVENLTRSEIKFVKSLYENKTYSSFIFIFNNEENEYPYYGG